MAIWFTSDLHLGHARFLTFDDSNGHPIRPFSCVEEMNETIIDRWNAVVRPEDKIYVLGDVYFGDYDALPDLIGRLNGKKRLTPGNHDKITDPRLLGCFQKVMLWRMFKDHGFIASHVPMLPDQFERKFKVHVHGHTHAAPDSSPQHMNICVERTDYRPVSLDELTERVRAR